MTEFDSIDSTRRKQEELQNTCYHPSGNWIPFDWQNLTQTFPERITQLAAQHPERLAVEDESMSLTYSELEQASNAAAYTILEKIGPGDDIVTLLAGAHVKAVIATIGIMKAGKIFVGIEESFPLHRHQQMISETDSPLIITDQENLPRARELALSSREIIQIETLPSTTSQPAPPPPTPDDLAILCFTSGTTGRPKAVIANHRSGIAETVRSLSNYHFCDADKITLYKSLAWSGTYWNCIGALSLGGSLAIFDMRRYGIDAMVDWLHGVKPTMVTGRMLANELTRTNSGERFPYVRILRMGGDTIYRKNVKVLQQMFPNAIIAVGLGISEAGRVTDMLIDADTPLDDDVLPLGYPLEEINIRILSDSGEELPTGEIGEIVVECPYLALGYWKRPDLTSERFQYLDGDSGRRIYYTGDLGRIRDNGMYQHLGRMDHMIKIRGHKVFPKDIESVLRTAPGVKEICIIDYTPPEDARRLVGYLEIDPAEFPGIETLHKRIDHLPNYMKPQNWVFVDEMPLNASRKIDRSRLPAPEQSRINVSAEFKPPRNPIEESLATIWAEILGIDGIGIHDNFMELGGDSLISTRIISKVRDKMGITLTFNDVFNSVTIAEMAEVIDQILQIDD